MEKESDSDADIGSESSDGSDEYDFTEDDDDNVDIDSFKRPTPKKKKNEEVNSFLAGANNTKKSRASTSKKKTPNKKKSLTDESIPLICQKCGKKCFTQQFFQTHTCDKTESATAETEQKDGEDVIDLDEEFLPPTPVKPKDPKVILDQQSN